MSEHFYTNGLCFSCTQCSKCCRFDPGYVFLSHEDLQRLADGLGVHVDRFREQYCRSVDLGLTTRLSLNEQDNYDCVFWYNGGCQVYEHRPLQCRTYPFWPGTMASEEEWNSESAHCPGIGIGPRHSAEDIDDKLKQRVRARMIGDNDET